MNTSTMMNQQRRGLAPNKRKDREYQKPSKFIKPSLHQRATGNTKQDSSASKNQLLAGYMAYEFLNNGTLFGQPWEQIAKPGSADEPSKVKRHEKYVEIAGLIKANGGVQIPGVVNPTQVNPVSQLW